MTRHTRADYRGRNHERLELSFPSTKLVYHILGGRSRENGADCENRTRTLSLEDSRTAVMRSPLNSLGVVAFIALGTLRPIFPVVAVFSIMTIFTGSTVVTGYAVFSIMTGSAFFAI
jgi:hypothetical protein